MWRAHHDRSYASALAAGLAGVSARGGRAPALHQTFGLPNRQGLADLLADGPGKPSTAVLQAGLARARARVVLSLEPS